jgi:molecular chaperone GrpE
MTEEKQAPTEEQPASEAPPTNDTMAAELESLRMQLRAAEQARDDYLKLARQIQADFVDYQKRNARDLATERRYAQIPLAADLLPVLDNLERALDAAQKAGDNGPLAQGVAMVQTQLLDILRRHGVSRLEAAGQPFDAEFHKAVMQQPTTEQPPQTVLQVLEPGYMFHERLLRPASVIVAVAPS